MGMYHSGKCIKYVCIEDTLIKALIYFPINKGDVVDIYIQETFMSYDLSTFYNYYYIQPNGYEIRSELIKNFIPLAEWREKQINEIINE